jgi:hypothetical protein
VFYFFAILVNAERLFDLRELKIQISFPNFSSFILNSEIDHNGKSSSRRYVKRMALFVSVTGTGWSTNLKTRFKCEIFGLDKINENTFCCYNFFCCHQWLCNESTLRLINS